MTQHQDLHLQLESLFEDINRRHFDGFLDPPILAWNSRLRSSAGRFIPGSRKFLRESPPVIEVASYLLSEPNARELVADTLAHEMIHYWLWVRRKAYGHTPEFWDKMTSMGVSRYNPVPRTRPFRYIYRCPVCQSDFPARRKLGVLACARCCRQHAGGTYDSRFRLFLAQRCGPASERLKKN
jgi:predicted SprT family Zn-dependent metalloprotease